MQHFSNYFYLNVSNWIQVPGDTYGPTGSKNSRRTRAIPAPYFLRL